MKPTYIVLILIAILSAALACFINVASSNILKSAINHAYTNAFITHIKKNIESNERFLTALEENPKVSRVLHKYNLSLIGKPVFVDSITPISNGLYRVTLRVEVTPILYMIVEVIIDNKLNIVKVLNEPKFSMIPPSDVERELSVIRRKGWDFLENISAVESLLRDPKVIKALKDKGILVDIKILANSIERSDLGLNFNIRTGKFDSYVLSIQLVKVKTGDVVKWVSGKQYITMLRNYNHTNIKCLEQVVLNIYFDIAQNNIAIVKNVETFSIPVCIIEIQTHIAAEG